MAFLDQSASESNAQGTLTAAVEASNRSKELTNWVLNSFEQCKNDRLTHERQWYMNLAFFFGKHYMQMVSVRGSNTFKLNTPAAPPWRVRLVVNKVRPIIRHEIARLTSQKPTFSVVPSTTEDEDIAAARVGEQIFVSAYSEKKINKVLRQAVWWASICGTGFLKSYWNPTAVVDQETIGDIKVERISPFHIYVPDLTEEDLQNQPYLIHASYKDPEWVKMTYGIDAPTTTQTNALEDAFLNLVGAKTTPREQVLILEMWVRPGTQSKMPNGGLLTLVGGHLVQVIDKFPYLHGELPFYKMDIIPTGKFYGESNITDLLPLQKEYNRTKSQIVEAKNIMAKPRLIAPRGSVNPRQITSEPGQVILYTPGFEAPRPLPIDSLPSYVMEELDRLNSEMDDISGQHEITRGNNPSQVTAATAISYLQEQDDTKLGYAVASIEEALQSLGQHYLNYVVQYWDDNRLVKVVGQDGTFEAINYKKNALKGNTDIRVQAGSALPQSKAARQAYVMDLIKLGVIPVEQSLELLDIGGMDKVYEDYLVDKRQAERENLKMAEIDPNLAMQLIMPQMDPATGLPVLDPNTGEPAMPPPVLPANTWDNHQAHIMIHNRFRKTQQFELLPDVIKHIFEQHVQIHTMAMTAYATQQPGGNAGPVIGPDGMVPPGADPYTGASQPPQQQEQPPQQQGGF